jgi:hypothetical protein
MTTDQKPLFMSQEHVAIMNERMAASTEVRQLLATLDRPLALAFELTAGPEGKTVHWALVLADTASFSLQPHPSADVTMRGDWTSMIQQTLGQSPRSEITPTGNLELLPKIMELLEAIRPYGTVPVELPDLRAV